MHHYGSSNHHHHHHHQASFEGTNTRLHEQAGMAAPYAGYGGGYAPSLSCPGLPSSGSGIMDDDEMALGAPPLLPPTLKRARACSYSPRRNTREFLSDEERDGRQ